MKMHIIGSLFIWAMFLALAPGGSLSGRINFAGPSMPPNPSISTQVQEEPKQRAILVTGASSGIGKTTALLLAKNGFYVYAGARKEKDIKALSAIKNIEGLRLDVTIPKEIDAAVKTIKSSGRGLFGLINNAGVAVIAPLIEVAEDDLHFQLDVNVYGPYRVTKAFASLLIKSKGRVSSTGSLSGSVAWGMGGPYCMSKHALEAFTDVLAIEMGRFGVQVSLIEPGNYKSRITENMRERFDKRGFTSKGSHYKGTLDRILAEPSSPSKDPEPDDVAAAFLHAMSDKKPKRRYLVVPNQREAEVTIKAAIRRVVQLNQDHPFSYNRERLIEMLDVAITGK
ncbi:MAG: NAD(P)-dependent dehydrogenase (short-subunit alcohol dehydrogenase family) [Planctomycetota bacterium]